MHVYLFGTRGPVKLTLLSSTALRFALTRLTQMDRSVEMLSEHSNFGDDQPLSAVSPLSSH